MTFQGISAMARAVGKQMDEDRQIQEFQDETRRIEARRAAGYKLSEEAKAEIRTLVEQIVDEKMSVNKQPSEMPSDLRTALARLVTEISCSAAAHWSPIDSALVAARTALAGDER